MKRCIAAIISVVMMAAMHHPTTHRTWKDTMAHHIYSADEWATLINDPTEGMVGDGNWTCALANGDIAWVTGDTLSGEHNTVRIVETNQEKPFIGWAHGTQTIGLLGNTSNYWLGPCISYGYGFLSLATELDPNTNQPIKAVLAVFDQTGHLNAVLPTPSTGPDVIQWNAGITYAYGQYYVFGQMHLGGEFGSRIYLARVSSFGDALHNWQYYSGVHGWSYNPGDAWNIIGPEHGNMDTAFNAIHAANGQWVLPGKKGGKWGDMIGAFTADYISGPYTWTPIQPSTPDEYLVSVHEDIPVNDPVGPAGLFGGIKHLMTVNREGQPAAFLAI